MNYLRQINAFYDALETNPLPAPAIALWHALHAIANKTGWKKEFTVSVSVLCLRAGLNESAVKRARNRLKEAGLIQWKSRGANRAALYKLMDCAVQNQAQREPQDEPHGAPHEAPQAQRHGEPIHRQNENETKREAPPKSPQGERVDDAGVVELFNCTCPSLPRVRDLTDARRRAIAARAKGGATLLDFAAVFAAVEQSDFLTGRSGAWHGCGFDWILKPANWQKIKEGNYADKPSGTDGATTAGTPDTGSGRKAIGLVL